MPEVSAAQRMADRLLAIAAKLDVDRHALSEEGWKVSAQQIKNAVSLLYDVERRLRNGDDWRG
jgi:hypothetical protein